MATGTKVFLGVDDGQYHDPSVSTVQQTFDRIGENGATVSAVKKIGSNSIPMLDPAYVTSGRGGFWELHAGTPTQTNLNLEAAVRLLRKQQRRVINVEGLGMIPNDSSDATGAINRQIWDTIILDLIARGGTPYFPTVGDAWYFKRHASDSGTKILPFYRYNVANDRTPPDFVLMGDGPGSRIKACPGAPKTDDLAHVRGRGVIFMDIVIDRNVADAGTNGVALRCDAFTAQPVLDMMLLNVQLLKGSRNLSIEHTGVAAQTNRRLVIHNLILDGSWNENAYIQDMAGILASQVRWTARTAGVGGVICTAAAAGDSISDIQASDVIGYTGGDFVVRIEAPVTFAAASHGRVKLHSVRPVGFLSITDVDRVTLSEAVPGIGVLVNYSKAAVVFSKLRILDAECFGGSEGVLVNVTGGAGLIDWLIRGGTFERCLSHGVRLVASGASSTLRKGRVTGISAIENGQGGAANGISIEALAAGVVRGTIVSHNHLYDLQGVKTQAIGVDEIGADWTYLGENAFEGNGSAAYSITGANSVIGTNLLM